MADRSAEDAKRLNHRHTRFRKSLPKREITNAFLITDDDIIITDPESEYAPLVNALHGQVVKISVNSDQYINPLDLNLDYSDEQDPVALKMDFVFSFCELAANRKSGLKPEEKSVLDRGVQIIYRPYMENPVPENLPILEDLYNVLLEMEEPDARYLATVLEIYVTGSYKVFNHRTNVNLNNRLICFDIRELGKQLKKLGMLVIQDQVWNRVTKNRAEKKTTWFYQDEFHDAEGRTDSRLLRRDLEALSKMGRYSTAITQNVKDPWPRGDRKYLRQLRLHLHAESSRRRSGNFSEAFEHSKTSCRLSPLARDKACSFTAIPSSPSATVSRKTPNIKS